MPYPATQVSRGLVALLAWSLTSLGLLGQQPPPELGFPVLRAFSSSDYESHYQTWGGVQTDDGVIHIGANGDLVQFDGKSWTRGGPAPSRA